MKLFGYHIPGTNTGDFGVSTLKSPAASTLPQTLDGTQQQQRKKPTSFVPKENDDGASLVSAGGYFGQYIDIDGTSVTSDQELITKYRVSAEQPEADLAINHIVNEAIVSNEVDGEPVSLAINDLDYTDEFKEEIMEEFSHIVKLLEFNQKAQNIFHSWYVDGRIYYHIIVDEENPEDGILELRSIDPIKMRKVREVEATVDQKTGARLLNTTKEYFVYNENQIAGNQVAGGSGDSLTGLAIDPSAICYVHSGLLDSTRKRVLSCLHKALKPINQLRMMEDSLVIYRLSRAPERRIFYIDVGNLPKGKAEEYMQGIMSKYRNKMVYDATTGDLKDDRRHMSMLEDFWLPRREGGRGTEITTLPGGDNLGQIDDILFFTKKMYRALNVPMSRFEAEGGFNLGRSTEISREEVSFQKFINNLRGKFSHLFLDLLRIQLILKGVIDEKDWDEIKSKLRIDFQRDNYFTELKEFEILRERLTMLGEVQPHVGKYFSENWVRKTILRQSDEDVEQMNTEIKDGIDEANEAQQATASETENVNSEGEASEDSNDEVGELELDGVEETPRFSSIDGEAILTSEELQSFCQENNIEVSPYSPEIPGEIDWLLLKDKTGKESLVDPEIATLEFLNTEFGITTTNQTEYK